MNSIHKINAINQQELDNNVSDSASWHADYSDTPYIYIGNLEESLKEKDILAIFAQYGNPTHINLIKDRETGKSRGFCYLKYEEQRSCVLAVDNFNGTLIYEKPLRVDHTYYRLIEGQREDDFLVEYPTVAEIEPKQKEVKAPKLLPFRSTENVSLDQEDFEDPLAGMKDLVTLNDENDFEDPMAKMATTKEESKHRSERSHRREKSHRRDHRDDKERSHKRSRSHRSEREDAKRTTKEEKI